MATFAIGDVQGCYTELRYLLDEISFDFEGDEVWFTGDLVNRGPDNLKTLRFVKKLGDRATVVLGNHDLYLLSIVYGGHSLHSNDTFVDVLRSSYCEELCHWLRHRPMLHESHGHLLVHAGVPHVWDKEKAMSLAREVERAIRGSDYVEFFRGMLGNEPAVWQDEHSGLDRLRCITNYLTRMRFIHVSGKMDFSSKLGLGHAPSAYRAWFQFPPQFEETIVFGHWASLNGRTQDSQFRAIDTGCVWGRRLTAYRLDDNEQRSVAAQFESESTLGRKPRGNRP